MKLFNKVIDMLNEGVTNLEYKNELADVLDVAPEDITVKRYSKDGAWIIIKGYTRKLRATGSNVYVGTIGFNLDSDYQMEGLREEMQRYKENEDYEQLALDLESFTESEDYPKDDCLIDFESASNEEIEKWLNDNNDQSEHSDDFNKLWLDVYKYLQRRKEREAIKNEADLVPREAGEIDPERRADLVARLKKYWPRVPKAWIDSRTDDYIEQVVTSYENRDKKPSKEELQARAEQKKKEDFKAKLASALDKNKK